MSGLLVDTCRRRGSTEGLGLTMSSAFAALGLAFRALLNGAETVANEVKHITGFYLKGLLVLALLAIFLPIPFVVAGVYWDLRWLIALGEMGWGICTLGLAVLGS